MEIKFHSMEKKFEIEIFKSKQQIIIIFVVKDYILLTESFEYLSVKTDRSLIC